jgi:hypothetical protein
MTLDTTLKKFITIRAMYSNENEYHYFYSILYRIKLFFSNNILIKSSSLKLYIFIQKMLPLSHTPM